MIACTRLRDQARTEFTWRQTWGPAGYRMCLLRVGATIGASGGLLPESTNSRYGGGACSAPPSTTIVSPVLKPVGVDGAAADPVERERPRDSPLP
jgi:hypothetical protein